MYLESSLERSERELSVHPPQKWGQRSGSRRWQTWSNVKDMNIQINAVSGKQVTGKNLEAVMISKSRFGWKSDRWATYNQIKKAGGVLDSRRAKGKGVRCVSYPKDEKPIWYSLFNLDLVDGWPEPEAPAKPKRKPGRPKGSKNKPAEGKTVTLTEAQLEALIANAINQALAS